jgi:hypothetical protein
MKYRLYRILGGVLIALGAHPGLERAQSPPPTTSTQATPSVTVLPATPIAPPPNPAAKIQAEMTAGTPFSCLWCAASDPSHMGCTSLT